MTVFALAAITDWADGYLARKLGQTSAFGAFLDPVADKLMVAAALIVLVQLDRADASLAIIIIGREIAISALREWMAQLGQSKSMAVAFIGKVKTGAQITAIIALLLYQPLIPGISTVLAGDDRAVGRRHPDAVVDVPLPAPRGAASARRGIDRRGVDDSAQAGVRGHAQDRLRRRQADRVESVIAAPRARRRRVAQQTKQSPRLAETRLPHGLPTL